MEEDDNNTSLFDPKQTLTKDYWVVTQYIAGPSTAQTLWDWGCGRSDYGHSALFIETYQNSQLVLYQFDYNIYYPYLCDIDIVLFSEEKKKNEDDELIGSDRRHLRLYKNSLSEVVYSINSAEYRIADAAISLSDQEHIEKFFQKRCYCLSPTKKERVLRKNGLRAVQRQAFENLLTETAKKGQTYPPYQKKIISHHSSSAWLHAAVWTGMAEEDFRKKIYKFRKEKRKLTTEEKENGEIKIAHRIGTISSSCYYSWRVSANGLGQALLDRLTNEYDEQNHTRESGHSFSLLNNNCGFLLNHVINTVLRESGSDEDKEVVNTSRLSYLRKFHMGTCYYAMICSNSTLMTFASSVPFLYSEFERLAQYKTFLLLHTLTRSDSRIVPLALTETWAPILYAVSFHTINLLCLMPYEFFHNQYYDFWSLSPSDHMCSLMMVMIYLMVSAFFYSMVTPRDSDSWPLLDNAATLLGLFIGIVMSPMLTSRCSDAGSEAMSSFIRSTPRERAIIKADMFVCALEIPIIGGLFLGYVARASLSAYANDMPYIQLLYYPLGCLGSGLLFSYPLHRKQLPPGYIALRCLQTSLYFMAATVCIFAFVEDMKPMTGAFHCGSGNSTNPQRCSELDTLIKPRHFFLFITVTSTLMFAPMLLTRLIARLYGNLAQQKPSRRGEANETIPLLRRHADASVRVYGATEGAYNLDQQSYSPTLFRQVRSRSVDFLDSRKDVMFSAMAHKKS